MNRFSYVRAASVDEAVAALAADAAAKVVAGGTNLIDLIKYNVERPTRLVDITRIPGLDRIEETEGGGLRIGALVPNTEVAYDQRITERYPLLSSAILAGATPQLRNAATTGGNLNRAPAATTTSTTRRPPAISASPGPAAPPSPGSTASTPFWVKAALHRHPPVRHGRCAGPSTASWRMPLAHSAHRRPWFSWSSPCL